MLLENKVAIIYGTGGAIGGAVARAFAREGARLFLAGRTPAKLDQIAADVRAICGSVETAVVDATDEPAVDAFVDGVANRAGSVDISANLISYGDVQQPLMEISAADFLQPIATAMRTHFLTTRAAARHMLRRGSGVILAFGGGGPQTVPGLGGFKVALDAVESLRRQWVCELGRQGIRFVTLKSAGITETLPDDFPGRDEIVRGIQQAALLNRTATLADVGHLAVFVASDQGGAITGTAVNISCGALLD